jgi:hypothetical protein
MCKGSEGICGRRGGDDLLAEAYEMVRGLGGDMKVFDRYWRA